MSNATKRGTQSVKLGKILVIGDTHFSESYMGSHKDYLAEGIWLMKDILKKIDSDTTGVIFLGDIFGVKEQRLKTLLFRSNAMNFFKAVRKKLERNNKKAGLPSSNVVLACVKGNHDMSGSEQLTEFEFFLEQGMFTNPEFIDLMGIEGQAKTRLHFMNYGDENNELPILEGNDTSNVVFAHGEFLIEGRTTWITKSRNGVQLAGMTNLQGVSLLISGHIHTPSVSFESTTLPDNSVIKLFYPGSPARVAERVEDVFYIEFSAGVGGEVEVEVKNFDLPPVEDVFLPKEQDAGIEPEFKDEEFEARNQRLKEILEDIISSRISQGDLSKQIDRVPSVSDEARKRAKEYLLGSNNEE